MIRFTLRQLEYAVTAADLGSVAAAAEALGVAQPSVSAALKKLEEQAGLNIFIRQHALGVLPSPQGTRFLAEARRILADAEALQKSTTETRGPMAGQLNIGSFLTLAPTYAPRLISDFNKLNANVNIRLQEGVQDELLRGLRSGALDLALLYNVDLPPDIRAADVAFLRPYVLLPGAHKLAKKTKIPLQDLANEKLILLDIQPSRTYFLRLLEAQGVKPVIGFSSPSLELVRGMVGRGLGYSLLITRPYGDRTYDGEKLAVREIAGDVERGVVSVASLKQMRLTRVASAFESFCIKHFKSLRVSS
jgi:DNA-binding transcriptional LysR family regulator